LKPERWGSLCWFKRITGKNRPVTRDKTTTTTTTTTTIIIITAKIAEELKVCGFVHLQSLEQNNQLDATINRKIYCLVVQTLLNMFRALQYSSSGARQTAVAASGFRMNVEVEVFSAVVDKAINFTIDCCI